MLHQLLNIYQAGQIKMFDVSLWRCYTFLCSPAFSFFKPFMTVTSLFLSEQGCCRNFSMLGQPGLAGTSILELGIQRSLSEKVLLISRTAIQWGRVSPLHLPPLSLLMGSVMYSLWLARHFSSKVVNQLCNSSSSLVRADHPDARCGFVAVERQGNMTGDWEAPVSEPGWSCGHITVLERGRAG